MVSPIDIQCCYDAILSASQCCEMKLMSDKEFTEMRMVLLQIARKYAAACMGGKIRAEDLD